MPVGLWRGAWDSSLISSKIYGILLSEIMGYQVEYGTGSGSYSYIWMLAGCSQLNPTDIQADCVPPRRWHFAFESWQEGRPYVRPALLAMGEYAPASLGSPGYAGYQGLFVMSLPSMASASWFEPQRYIPVVDEVNMTKLLTCAEAVNTAYPFLGQQYLEATADEGGVEYQDDRPLLKCWKGKWWAAPSCRHNVSYCGAVVTGGLGWGMVELVQQASFHNMPLAFATAIQTPNEYVQLNIELQSALYWWTPDSTFVEYGAQRVVFPEHNSQEYRNGIYGTQRTEAFLSTWAAGGLDSEQAQGGEFPLSLAKKFHLSNSYFSTVDAPGEIYRCFGDVGKCPGGPPGTCALGRDRRSVACSRCESGKHAEARVLSSSCFSQGLSRKVRQHVRQMALADLALVLTLQFSSQLPHPSPLLIVTISLAQMITIAQKLTVLAKFKIGWDEPFLSVLHSIQLLNFDLKHISIDCISQVAPLVEFSIRVLLMPLFCLLVLIVHFLYSAFFSKRSMCGSFQLAQLGRTVGTIFIICFISVFSSLLSPFQCVKHPNGKFTLQDTDKPSSMFPGSAFELMGMGRRGGASEGDWQCPNVECINHTKYVFGKHVPKRLEESNQNFIRACSFLFTRFRILTAFYKPWRFLSCNLLDIWLIAGLMVFVLFLTNVFLVSQVGMGFLVSMIVAIFVAAVYGASKHIMQQYFRKRFDFFLCHQKSAAGSFARLLKIELTKANHSAFIDSDDLLDITRLCRYVAQDTQKFVILATPDILGRKWCVAET
ncbi:40S ribosomal protein S6 [Durusdinium trenchii]|uniref:40S ribosomal protein S6 n=1 Tax=Durusdinium trenchii TaxID=1381693 RepID=A0ABP0RZS6_9DINO